MMFEKSIILYAVLGNESNFEYHFRSNSIFCIHKRERNYLHSFDKYLIASIKFLYIIEIVALHLYLIDINTLFYYSI